ncbi:hypothetical protein P153DRAFT_359278 [Dothidotthia symphoricarpi CBS 119687]|uniref:Uncharacterized protein n=1 Tax=Dothidotthia symphoricarpi CBS 119687 TaxID=1392245 RepID=A0A6A6A817_9PLEO|nr:uncharacterized protein P153DRAFT_359278 [Dothidotthia symphoricarpi CBS 119687]KAF2126957.1 hypothetical protein P153DRAFT_359278 [Dothidotthia symphoricarpi CBS 119687]
MADLAFAENGIDGIFLGAFKDLAYSVLRSLPSDTDSNDTTIPNSVHTIATQLNREFARLSYVVEVIQARLHEDPAWVTTAIRAYELLTVFIDDDFTHPDPQMQGLRGAFLIRYQLMRACQVQFGEMMRMEVWSLGFIDFLGQLCNTGRITSLTPGIALNVMEGMVCSGHLALHDNFDLLVGFVLRAGPFLDTQTQQFRDLLTEKVQQLRQRTNNISISMQMAVYGIMQLREKGWLMEQLDGGTAQQDPMSMVRWSP